MARAPEQIRAEIEQVQARFDATDVHAKHFPRGTGQPGNASGRQTRRQGAARMDRSIDLATRLNALRQELNEAEARERRIANKPTVPTLEKRLNDALSVRDSGVMPGSGEPLDADQKAALGQLIKDTRQALKRAQHS